jgi:DNA repair exonuclease SbcCD ATPase subunit
MAGNKLVLKNITAKNFRSVGNSGMSLDYQNSNKTLIISDDNGAGKSTLSIWALYFALFGKPYKTGVKIASLVNSRSNKDCLVELDFTVAGSEWTVRRGYKPSVFELIRDGKLIENEAANGDMQAHLESVIGMNDKAFCSIVALGVDKFVPFIQMSSADRRAFVEQMLDLIVISGMNELTKTKVKTIRKELEQILYEYNIAESKLSNSTRTLNILEDKKQQRLKETGSELAEYESELTKTGKLISLADTKLGVLEKKLNPTARGKLLEINSMISRFEGKIKDIRSAADKIDSLHDCPTCKQSVDSDHKSSLKAAAEVEAGKLAEPIKKLQEQASEAATLAEEHDAVRLDINKVDVIKSGLESKVASLKDNIKKIKAKLVDTNEDELISKEQSTIEGFKSDIEIKDKAMTEKREVETEHLQLLQILKDDGIKANIVAQYIPFLNQTINGILDKLNLYIQIDIDKEFNVSMFAPSRKGQTIDNLSTGQLRRVDLAVLLAWREIAKNKASVDCNILILDEILENLSASGVSEFMEMWDVEASDTNLFVISQRGSEFDEYFDRSIMYKLTDDMTVEV